MTMLAIVLAVFAAQNKQAKDYFPLQLGLQWTYKVPTKEETKEVTCEVKAMHKSQPPQFDLKPFIVLPMENYEARFVATDDGIKLCGSKKIVKSEQLFIKSPLKKGETWEWKDCDGIVFKCKNEGEEEIEVPAGKFKTVKIVQETGVENGKVSITFWLAEKTGIVKVDFGHREGDFLIELKKFEKK